jgi:hypothetical protein
MTNDYSIPPLRDLPLGRLAQRAEHLHAEITREQQHRIATPRLTMPRVHIARPVLVAMIAALTALALVPIGGASLGARAIGSISSLWTPGSPPPAPAPYQHGDKVWTTAPPSGSSKFSPPAGWTTPQPPAYQQGDKVWTTTPPTTPQTTTTIICNTPSDAAKALAELEKEGSPITSVACR